MFAVPISMVVCRSVVEDFTLDISVSSSPACTKRKTYLFKNEKMFLGILKNIFQNAHISMFKPMEFN